MHLSNAAALRIWIGIVSLIAATAAAAETVEGVVGLTWGDGAPGAGLPSQLRVDLSTDTGQSIRLELSSLQNLVPDGVMSLNGARVRVELDSMLSTTARISKILTPVTETNFAGPAPSITGSQPWIWILCKFNDVAAEPKPPSYFTGMYADVAGTLQTYWREVSFDAININGSGVVGWFTLPHPRSYYVPASGSANLSTLFTDCTAAADPMVNFAAGYVGVNMMFNDDLDGYAWGGSRSATLDGVTRSWRSTWNPPWAYADTAGLGHEMGHGFGLPHANNSDGDTDPYDNPWDLMSDAWTYAASNVTYGRIPKHISIYHKDRLGWVAAARKQTLGVRGNYTITLDYSGLPNSTHMQMVQIPAKDGVAAHFTAIEARKRFGIYDANLGGDAVIVHNINTTRSEPAWVVDSAIPASNRANTESVMFKVGESYTPPDANYTLKVLSATADGFVISVDSDRIFIDGYNG